MDPLVNGNTRTAEMAQQAGKSVPFGSKGLVSFTPAQAEPDVRITSTESGVDTTLENTLIQSSMLAGHITQQWELNRNGRDVLNARLLRCLAAVKGEYNTDQLNTLQKGFGSSTIFYKLTGTKCNAASAWIREIMIPPGDFAWDLSPTTLPSLPPEDEQQARQKIFDAVLQVQQETGTEIDIDKVPALLERSLDAALEAIRDHAKKRSRRMVDKLRDIMEEGKWIAAFSEFIDHFTTYPTAIVKGPIGARQKSLTWGPQGEAIVQSKEGWAFKAVNPFDVYPAPQADSAQDGSFIERIRLTRAELYGYIGVKGYSEKAIRSVLQLHGAGMLTHWLETEGERRRLENSTDVWRTPPQYVDALHFWGSVEGRLLTEWGMEGIDDEDRFYEIDAVLVGGDVVRAEINSDPLGRRPYHTASFRPIPGAFWGMSIPELMLDTQAMCNACARSIEDNLAISAMPQVAINIDAVPPGEDLTAQTPGKVWTYRSKDDMGAEIKGDFIKWFAPPTNTAELLRVMEEFERRADDETGIPRYSYGNQNTYGAASTASGLEMLMTQAAKGIRRAVGIIDENVIQPLIEQLFTQVMLYDPDSSIKGDCKVVPRGTAALLIKSQIQQSRISFLQTIANPIFAPILGENGIRILLEETARAMDLPVDKLFSELDRLKREAEAEAAKNAPPQPSPDVALKAQVDMAKLEAQKQEAVADASISLAQLGMQKQKDMREAANLSTTSKRPYPAKLK